MLTDKNLSIAAAYCCHHGCHERLVEFDMSANIWRIQDTLSSYQNRAVLSWRLAPSGWKLHGSVLMSSLAKVSVRCSSPIQRLGLVTGFESRFYGRKTMLPVLEIEVASSKSLVVITTEIQL